MLQDSTTLIQIKKDENIKSDVHNVQKGKCGVKVAYCSCETKVKVRLLPLTPL